ELGMNHPGEIRTLIRIAEPDVRVWTNVGDAHIGHFESREAIADAKAELLDAATPDTVLVANADDPLVVARTGKFVGRTVTFGEHPRADVRAQEIEDRGFDGTTARVRTRSGDATFSVPLAGRAQLSNCLAAVAVADHFNVPLAALVDRASHLRAFPRRGGITVLRDGTRLVDDSYNPTPPPHH